MPVRALLVPLFLVVLLASACGGGGTTLAVVDMQRALRECNDGRAAMTRLSGLRAQRQADLDHRQEALRTEQQAIATAQAQGQNVAGRQAAFQTQMTTLQAEFQQFQMELASAEQEATVHILEQLKSSLATLAASRGVDFVLDEGGGDTSYHGPHVQDLTADLIHAYDAQHH
jgi:outer membrane protein